MYDDGTNVGIGTTYIPGALLETVSVTNDTAAILLISRENAWNSSPSKCLEVKDLSAPSFSYYPGTKVQLYNFKVADIDGELIFQATYRATIWRSINTSCKN